jgi:hypothetical protein
MRAYDADLVPVQKVDGWETQILVDEARAYLEPLGFDLVESAQAAEDAERGTPAEQPEANQPPEPCLDLESRDSQIVDFIIACKGKRQKNYIKLATTQFSLADSTIRKIWSEGKPSDYWPTPKRPRL